MPFDAVGLSGLFGPLGIGLAGAPVAAVLGWWLSPHIVSSSWRHAIAIGLRAGLLAPLLGLLEFLYVVMVAALADRPGQLAETAAGLLFVGMYGLGFCWVVLPITIPSGIAAAMIVRGLLPRYAWTAQPSASIEFRPAVTVLALVALRSPRAVRAGRIGLRNVAPRRPREAAPSRVPSCVITNTAFSRSRCLSIRAIPIRHNRQHAPERPCQRETLRA